MGCCESTQRKTNNNSGDKNGSSVAQDHVAEAGAALATLVALCVIGILIHNAGRKTMKAPGRNYRIFRDDFEKDPADYFRNLRK